jgi:hypothetical protein
VAAPGRFEIDCSHLFLFSSADAAMMPGNILLRTVRVEERPSTDATVLADRARDKLLSMLNEQRVAKVDAQRCGHPPRARAAPFLRGGLTGGFWGFLGPASRLRRSSPSRGRFGRRRRSSARSATRTSRAPASTAPPAWPSGPAGALKAASALSIVNRFSMARL